MASVNVQSSVSVGSTSSMESRQKIQQDLMNECELTWEHIQQTHHRLATHKKDKPPVGLTDKSNATFKILQHKEKKLQTQLDLLKNQDVEVASKDLHFVKTLLQDNMKKNISELQQTLGIVKEERLEVAADIAMQRKLLQEEKAIQRSLEEKIQEFEDDDQELHQKNVVAELQTKKKEAAKYHLTVMNQLGKFLSNHFPAPDEEENLMHQRKYCTLQHIIETLMNRLFESPHDCYMKILPTYWPPYIQLLLRSNIIQRHPDNCELIKLVAFHN